MALPNVIQIPDHFPIQSYLLAAAETASPVAMAVVNQPSTQGIVPATRKNKPSQNGVAIGLAPWSKAPVAVVFDFGDGGTSSEVILKPGQVFMPSGKKEFKGFDYGLPFGWLGGGDVTLFLFKTEDAIVYWSGIQSEVLFHRFRTTILAEGSPVTAPGYKNLPVAFPVDNMFRYDSTLGSQSQGGKPVIEIAEVTRMSLRLNNTVALIDGDNAMRVVVFGADDFDADPLGVAGAPTSAESFYYDLTWPVGFAGFAAADKPILSVPRELAAQGSNYWGMACYAPTGSALVGLTVDVVRYGRL